MIPLWRDVEGVSISCLNRADEVRELVKLFSKIAAAAGWQPEGALERWLERSTYFGLWTNELSQPPEGKPQLIGGLQLVAPDAQGQLPCHDLWPEILTIDNHLTRPQRSCHIAMMGIATEYRGHRLHFWRLGVEMWRYCVENGIDTLLIEVTPRVLPLYQRLGWPLHPCGALRLHWGEECYLCRLDVAEVAQVLLSRAWTSPHYHQIIAQAVRVTSPPTIAPLSRSSPLTDQF